MLFRSVRFSKTYLYARRDHDASLLMQDLSGGDVRGPAQGASMSRLGTARLSAVAALRATSRVFTLGCSGRGGAGGPWSGRSVRTLCSDQVACIGFAAQHQEFVRPGTCSRRQTISYGQSTRFRPPPKWSQVEP